MGLLAPHLYMLTSWSAYPAGAEQSQPVGRFEVFVVKGSTIGEDHAVTFCRVQRARAQWLFFIFTRYINIGFNGDLLNECCYGFQAYRLEIPRFHTANMKLGIYERDFEFMDVANINQLLSDREQQIRDTERLRALSICHYVLGGITMCYSSLFLVHFGFGLMMVLHPEFLKGVRMPCGAGGYIDRSHSEASVLSPLDRHVL
jgi:hypothetical protein